MIAMITRYGRLLKPCNSPFSHSRSLVERVAFCCQCNVSDPCTYAFEPCLHCFFCIAVRNCVVWQLREPLACETGHASVSWRLTSRSQRSRSLHFVGLFQCFWSGGFSTASEGIDAWRFLCFGMPCTAAEYTGIDD